MAAKEPYDFSHLPIAVATYDYTLAIAAQGVITEEGAKNQIVHTGDDGSEEVVTLSSTSIWYVSWSWKVLSKSDAGTILDLYHNTSKANGMAKTFRWAYSGHTYVVRFATPIKRVGNNPSWWSIPSVQLKIVGKIADA